MSTPELEYTAIRDADLGPLRDAVRKWKKLPEKIETVTTTFSRTVSGPLVQSGWYGETAEAAFKKFKNVHHQMTEAPGQAEKISIDMSEALSTFELSQDEIRSIEKAVTAKPGNGGKNYLKLDESKGVVSIDQNHEDDIPDLEKLQQKVDECNRRISTAISDASKADHALKTVLQIDPPGRGFNDDIAGHLRDVKAETKEDVDALMKLAHDPDLKKDTKKLSKFNGLLAKNAKNSDFAEQFATRKGAKGILEFWNRTAQPEYGEDEYGFPKEERLSAARRKQLAALQDNLGTTLALASHSDSPKMTQWKHDVIALGDNRLPALSKPGTHDAPPPYGFQVMSNLMRTGKWDGNFLNDYGDKLLKEDKRPFEARSGREEDRGYRKWLSEGLKPVDYLNFGPKADEGADPMTGFLEAMGHNGPASTEFFNDKGHFDYLLRDREYIQDGANNPDFDPKKDVVPSRTALGRALTSATTGHSWDAPVDLHPSHTKDEAHIMSELMKGVASRGDHITMAPGMHEALGRAAAEYTPDIYRAMKDGADYGDIHSSSLAKREQAMAEAKLFPMSGAQADINHMDATHFLLALGQDPDSHATVPQAQKAYAAETLDHYLSPDTPAEEKYGASRKETAEEILKTSGEVSGTLTIGRQEALIGPAVASDADFEKATLSDRLWSGAGVASGLAMGVAKMQNPVAAAAISSITSGTFSAASSDADALISHHEAQDKAHAAYTLYNREMTREVDYNWAILSKLEKQHHIDLSDAWAGKFAEEGFGQAKDRVQGTADYLSSSDQVASLPTERAD